MEARLSHQAGARLEQEQAQEIRLGRVRETHRIHFKIRWKDAGLPQTPLTSGWLGQQRRHGRLGFVASRSRQCARSAGHPCADRRASRAIRLRLPPLGEYGACAPQRGEALLTVQPLGTSRSAR